MTQLLSAVEYAAIDVAAQELDCVRLGRTRQDEQIETMFR